MEYDKRVMNMLAGTQKYNLRWLGGATLLVAMVFFSLSLDAQPGRGRGGGGGRGAGRGGGGGFFGGAPGPRIEPRDLSYDLGVARIEDREAFAKLSYKGPDVMRDSYLANLEFVKFVIEYQTDASPERVYFMNTNNHRAHPRFMPLVGIDFRAAVRGAITFLPRLRAPNGEPGLYIFDFQPNDSYGFEEIKRIRDILVSYAPVLNGRVAFHPLQGNLERYEREENRYNASDVAVHLDEDLLTNISFLPLNEGESFGRLRVMENETRPSPRDIVICQTLPNQMPRVAGVISEVRQTPLSHVNLRAVQDRIPNAYIHGALLLDEIRPLIGKWVKFRVSEEGFDLREATTADVNAHFEAMRPEEAPQLVRDLKAQAARRLDELAFSDSASFGVKAANLASLHQFDLPANLFPKGVALPFYFYDEFMKHNGFYAKIETLLSDPAFNGDREQQIKALKGLRSKIKEGAMPAWMMRQLGELQGSFAEGQSIRCRSSTNNEDLPGFSGAGLYDSYTHRPEEGHLSKTIKQVYASLWNFRAFEEREFYRIDHRQVAMGVLMHPNYKGELANGVAVTDDILYESQGNYYLNTQLGEDLVTNPDANSSPEELLLAWYAEDGFKVVRRSNDAGANGQLLKGRHLDELRSALARIHARFRGLYGASDEDGFAMEVEYKITKDDQLVIKQARPWVN